MKSDDMKRRYNSVSNWYLIDAADKVLGRLASDISQRLMGKMSVNFARHKAGDYYVVVINTDKVVLTGRKEKDKKYYRHSGYLGGLKIRTVEEQRQKDSRVLVRKAVSGMLPGNNLRKVMLKNLKLFKGSEHLHEAQLRESSRHE